MSFDIFYIVLTTSAIVWLSLKLKNYGSTKLELERIKTENDYNTKQLADKDSFIISIKEKLENHQRDYTEASNKLATIQAEKAGLINEQEKQSNKIIELEQQAKKLNTQIHDLDVIKAGVEAQKKALEERIDEQKIFILEAQKNLKEQFENLSNKQLKDNAKKFYEDSSKNLGELLNPLSEKIGEFKKEFGETYSKEAKERFSLENEIKRIVDVNNKMTSTTENLTKALKGEKKTQGNWGEVILEKLLEDAGLKKDTHFRTQENIVTDDGKRQLPDVLVMLPESKHIIVDSKVSLVSYEKYYSEELEDSKIIHAREFADAVKNHIKTLNSKSYQDSQSVSSLDFVIMFMPIEGTFQLVSQYYPDIFAFGWNNRVCLTSPATLFPILKTISSIWKVEAQNKNTQEIIKTATQLYDKFVSFASSLEEIGKSIDKSKNHYDNALSQLRDGRGSAISIVKKLESYGVDKKKSSKKMPEIMQDLSDLDNNEESDEAA